MNNYVDRSIGTFRYSMAIMKGNNRQVTQMIEHIDGEKFSISGDFLLTIGKKMVILTQDRKPVIVKRWSPCTLESYIDVQKMTVLSFSGVKVSEVYQDSDGWIWEGNVADGENSFRVLQDDKEIFTIEFD